MKNNLGFTPQQFSQEYKVNYQKILGKGHDATVFLVQDKQQKLFALKILAHATESNAINLFNEIQILLHIQHPNITQMIGFCTDFTCLLLELMPNGSLVKILTQGPLPIAIANGILLQLADALGYLHAKGITHGDLKLDNVLISNDYSVKICDFGFAKVNGQAPIPKNTICGSEGYTAPEVWTIPQDLKLCDVFSLGVIYYIMVTGHPPFESNNVQNDDIWWTLIKNEEWETYWKQMNLMLPQELKMVIQNILHADSHKRMNLATLIEWLKDKAASPQQVQEEIKKRLKQSK